ncbi:RNA 3'-terminal phosphate cyclase [Candidatus Woesearchaeota archaeon]|nr:RNA 3'-terminal phosphate cyclase [Candidatus Woesearchaeota archaeon]
MITLDGSSGEGGGALVRVALALSTFTGKEFSVANIRSGRKEPGLKAQHLTAIKALQKICSARTNEVKLGSTELKFTPGKIKAGRYEFDIGTAGSISLFLQAVLLPCLFAPRKTTITVIGGTSGKWASSVDYLNYVVLPHLRRFVEKIEIKIEQRGYYPEGGGKVTAEITPKIKMENSFTSLDFSLVPKIQLAEQGKLEQIKGLINVSAELEEPQVAERIRRAAEAKLRKYQVPINIRLEYAKSRSIGGEALFWAVFDTEVILGADSLIEKGRRSEDIGTEAAEKLIVEIDSGAAVDVHAEDQLIPFLALLPGSTIKVREVTQHAKTNIYVVEKFLPVKFEVKDSVIAVRGLFKA